jgi:hypothetical protein
MQHVFDGIDAAVVFEGEVLVVQYHPLVALFAGEALDVGKHPHGHHHYTAVGEIDGHHAAFLPKVELLDSKVGVFLFAHIWFISQYRFAKIRQLFGLTKTDLLI